MADYYSSMTVYPDRIPKSAFTNTEKEILEMMGLEFSDIGGGYYIYSSEYSASALIDAEDARRLGLINNDVFMEDQEDILFDEDYIIDIFKKICKKENIDYIYIHGNTSCSSMREGAFGGWAVFITANSFSYSSTEEFIANKINIFEKRKKKKESVG